MKSYTDIEQSKMLAEILPLESADMNWHELPSIGFFARTYPYKHDNGATEGNFPCWSLVGLLNVIPISYKDEGQYCFALINTNPSTNPVEWCACYEDCYGNMIMESYADNPVDACFDMIIKLKRI